MDFDSHRLSFGAAAAHYDRVRPTYPLAALTWALGSPPKRVVDLGAGTGLLSRVAIKAGFDVVPVEPDPGMRAQLDATTPGVTALAGAAEDIPLPDSSVDAVISGQAYHWFNPELAHPEIARVLKTGGVFAAMWNERDTTKAWAAKLDSIMSGGQSHQWAANNVTDFGPLFTQIETNNFEHVVTQSPQGLVDLISSRSYYLVATPEQQAELRAQVAQLCATDPELRGRDEFHLKLTTSVFRAFKK
ncbi:putative methyltransferase [Rhizocola hellebori]|uniref:Putative methyltransferase n=1 Tax=Rhizocola hellebori TaxID=1392758 RepID=A0A8J3QF00_9ACTN|nr:class I SAM-dependent methyltransferase [Rhizocola hellebori]GIH08375.1 putative methyltransferase [Rhizocola hellebori]